MKLDNRGLEPPEPMMRTLAALEDLADGEQLIIRNDRRPMFLFAELDERGWSYAYEEMNDSSFEITITKNG
ncbi:DUF2249 domain-containing protein [Bacillus marinisedimentorum]|uniref:DUF2249 domain-containing protein n=1 Tax=Bacillus marinisedimentorum TaxID=1821260 RepID=UPI0008727821|nr:DUF2249 domain-containing protein [Bacillus marinisedimentorum]